MIISFVKFDNFLVIWILLFELRFNARDHFVKVTVNEDLFIIQENWDFTGLED